APRQARQPRKRVRKLCASQCGGGCGPLGEAYQRLTDDYPQLWANVSEIDTPGRAPTNLSPLPVVFGRQVRSVPWRSPLRSDRRPSDTPAGGVSPGTTRPPLYLVRLTTMHPASASCSPML